MKKVYHVLFILGLFMGFNSCGSDDAENAIDCLFEPVNFNVNHVISPKNSKEVSFILLYTGEHNLDEEVTWNFGDGTTLKISGTRATHTYSDAGSYKVVVKPTVRNGDAFCSPSVDRNINVE
ncbi:PKD domain-containing protein [Pseudotamlana carrageenivorans]|uniref:PKD domain-containing protein n=1 Tax=Pseudotamlana carrageenivorans TaxID=2069432 RepID=A0A2I7SHQ9_9FLAO|nr:PKD domain-containing protein [Tamlana carrageenivorans]AUS05445.1 hypothetical protein C1A40_08170 [Tamlana carrageenivorans]